MLELHHERLSPGFEKFHIVGLPIALALHHFTAPDSGDPHDHPWDFRTHALSGGYVEELFTPEFGRTGSHSRNPGSSHLVDAETIHRITALPQGDCWTMVMAGPHRRETRFWRWVDGVAVSRRWDEEGF